MPHSKQKGLQKVAGRKEGTEGLRTISGEQEALGACDTLTHRKSHKAPSKSMQERRVALREAGLGGRV